MTRNAAKARKQVALSREAALAMMANKRMTRSMGKHFASVGEETNQDHAKIITVAREFAEPACSKEHAKSAQEVSLKKRKRDDEDHNNGEDEDGNQTVPEKKSKTS